MAHSHATRFEDGDSARFFTQKKSGYQAVAIALSDAARSDDGDSASDLHVPANIPADVRDLLVRSLGTDDTTGTTRAHELFVLSAGRSEERQRRKLIMGSIQVTNLPGDLFGRCKPFIAVRIGSTEHRTKTLTETALGNFVGGLGEHAFDVGVPVERPAVWSERMEFLFDKGIDDDMLIRVMEDKGFGWDEEIGKAQVPLRHFSAELKERSFQLLSASGSHHAKISFVAHVPATVEDGPVGTGVCFRVHDTKIIVDSLAAHYVCRAGVDPKPGDELVSVDGIHVRTQTFAQVVSLTLGHAGSVCHLQFERQDTAEIVESEVERCFLDVPAQGHSPIFDASAKNQEDVQAIDQHLPQESTFPRISTGKGADWTKEDLRLLQTTQQYLLDATGNRRRICQLRTMYSSSI